MLLILLVGAFSLIAGSSAAVAKGPIRLEELEIGEKMTRKQIEDKLREMDLRGKICWSKDVFGHDAIRVINKAKNRPVQTVIVTFCKKRIVGIHGGFTDPLNAKYTAYQTMAHIPWKTVKKVTKIETSAARRLDVEMEPKNGQTLAVQFSVDLKPGGATEWNRFIQGHVCELSKPVPCPKKER